MTALRELIRDTEGAVKAYGDYKTVPTNMQSNVRNDMYVTSETLRILAKTSRATSPGRHRRARQLQEEG